MNTLQILDQREVLGKEFTCYGDFETPLFLAKDVAEWIEYESSSINKLLNAVDENEKLIGIIFRAGQNREMWFLTEYGLYEILFQSKKPIAKQFKAQVKTILKEIRQKGYYSTLKPEDLLKKVHQELEYDHYLEDYIIPILEAQDEFSIGELMEQWIGFEIKTKDDWEKAKFLIEMKGKERKQRLSQFCYCSLDYRDNDKIHFLKWKSNENKTHCKKIKGVYWFDEYILNKLGIVRSV